MARYLAYGGQGPPSGIWNSYSRSLEPSSTRNNDLSTLIAASIKGLETYPSKVAEQNSAAEAGALAGKKGLAANSASHEGTA